MPDDSMVRSSTQFNALAAAAAVLLAIAHGQEESSTSEDPPPAPAAVDMSKAMPLDVSRTRLKNFLRDETALTPYLDTDGSPQDLKAVFIAGSSEARHALIWDSITCRLLGVLRIPRQKDSGTAASGASPYLLLAEGVHPLKNTQGTFDDPSYFGFRLVSGVPEFLYTYGTLVVEERIWLEESGNVLKQRFSFRNPQNEIKIAFPEAWKAKTSVTAGEWKEEILTVPADKAHDIVITYRLTGDAVDQEVEN